MGQKDLFAALPYISVWKANLYFLNRPLFSNLFTTFVTWKALAQGFLLHDIWHCSSCAIVKITLHHDTAERTPRCSLDLLCAEKQLAAWKSWVFARRQFGRNFNSGWRWGQANTTTDHWFFVMLVIVTEGASTEGAHFAEEGKPQRRQCWGGNHNRRGQRVEHLWRVNNSALGLRLVYSQTLPQYLQQHANTAHCASPGLKGSFKLSIDMMWSTDVACIQCSPCTRWPRDPQGCPTLAPSSQTRAHLGRSELEGKASLFCRNFDSPFKSYTISSQQKVTKQTATNICSISTNSSAQASTIVKHM